MKRRRILIALRAVVIGSVAEGLPCRAVSMLIALLQSPLVPNPWRNTDSVAEADFTRTFIHDFVMPFLE